MSSTPPVTGFPLSPLQATDAGGPNASFPPLQATDVGGGVTGVAVPAGSNVTVVDAPRNMGDPPDHFMWRYCVSMLMDMKEGVWALSLGRVLLMALFIHAVVTWSMGRDIPEHEMGTLWGMLGYVFGSKITSVVGSWQK